ncbi:MAG: DNA polymerase Y family protein [Pseudomonadota bacterium]
MARLGRTNPHPDLFAGLVDERQQRRTDDAMAAVDAGPVVSDGAVRVSPVWIAVYLPTLALQAIQAQVVHDQSAAVIDDGQPATIVATNKAAYRKGIFKGQVLRSALALDSDLQVVTRQPEKEHALLNTIADQLLTFTSRVSLQLPHTVVLEVRASLRLFGGIEPLIERLSGVLEHRGLFFRHSIASTAIAACWFAEAGFCPDAQAVVTHGHHNPETLRALHALDIALTGWPDSHQQALSQMGVRTLADCRRLPRAGLLRRFGPNLLTSMGQAFGELPEVRHCISEQKTFESLAQLDAEITDAVQLQAHCETLLQKLEHFLRRHQSATRELRFAFHAWRGTAGSLDIRLGFQSYCSAHWQRLLVTHLERYTLLEPAVAVSLCADANEPVNLNNAALSFAADEKHADDGVERRATYEFVDRLRARLGEHGVSALQHVSSHFPPDATRLVTPLSTAKEQADIPADWWLRSMPMEEDRSHTRLLQRPLWLLQQEQPIQRIQGRLFYQGELWLKSGPERIAPAWWASDGGVRDYFVAETEQGTRLWVYRQYEATPGETSWWLHGVFG